jgi:hypothetical protein
MNDIAFQDELDCPDCGRAYPHQQNYTNRMLTSGLVRLTVWVPESKREELKSIAKKMREKCRK